MEYNSSNGCVNIRDANEVWSPLHQYMHNGKLNLGDPAALLEYNKAILFKLTKYRITIPENYLVPAICLRNTYIRIIKDLLDVQLIADIGTGASAVIALLAAKQGFSVVATELDEISYTYAQLNISANQLTDKITLYKSNSNTNIIDNVLPVDVIDKVECVLTYPPFYPEERPGRISRKKRGFKGSENELFSGETGMSFTKQYIIEAAMHGIQHITVLLHKQEFVEQCTTLMQNHGYVCRVIDIIAGNRKRYAVLASKEK